MLNTTKLNRKTLLATLLFPLLFLAGCSSDQQRTLPESGSPMNGLEVPGSDSDADLPSSLTASPGGEAGSGPEAVVASWMDVFNTLKSARVHLPASYRDDTRFFRRMRSGESGYQYISAALRQLKSRSKVRIPAGHYEIRLPEGSDSHSFFTLSMLRDKVIDFSHSTLSFYEPRTAFHFQQCERIAIQNARIVHRYPLASIGWLDRNAGQLQLIVTLTYRTRLGNLPAGFHKISTIYQAHENALVGQVPHIWRKNGSSYRLVDTSLIEAGIQEFNSGSGIYAIDQNHPLRTSLELFGADGTPLLIKHYTYGANAISANGGRDLTIEGIKIHGVPGMAFYLSNIESGVLIRNNIVRANKGEDPSSIFGATADGIHLSRVQSNVIVTGNQLADLGDDAINIYHGHFFQVESGDSSSIVVRRLGVGPSISVAPGSVASLFRNNLILKKEEIPVLSVTELSRSPAGQQRFRIQHQTGSHNVQPFSDFLAIASESGDGSVFIGNNHISNSTARGILAQAKTVMIKSNLIENTARNAIKITSDTRWFFEVGLPRNIKVYDNTIKNVAWDYLDNEQWTVSPGAINLLTEIDPGTRVDRKPYGMTGSIQDISILNNRISDTPISLTHFGVRGLRIYSNIFSNDSGYLNLKKPGVLHGWFLNGPAFGENSAGCESQVPEFCGN